VIDATGEKFSMAGSLYIPDNTAKSIERIQFRFGAVTKAGGSALTVSLQNLSAAAAFPTEPDEVQDQTVAIANADAGFVANTWYRTGTLSANRSVNPGDLLAVVWEYDGGGRLGADTVTISTWSIVGGANAPGNALKTGGTWAAHGSCPNVLFEFSDGTFGTFIQNRLVALSTTASNMNSGSGPDERAMEFTVPFPMKASGAWYIVAPGGASADFQIRLYEGTTLLQNVDVEADYLISTAARVVRVSFASEQILVPGVTYYLALRPTTANNLAGQSMTLNAAGHFAVWPGGTACYFNARQDSGAWSNQNTAARMLCGLQIAAIQQGNPASRVRL
jgi:hypothetical protein